MFSLLLVTKKLPLLTDTTVELSRTSVVIPPAPRQGQSRIKGRQCQSHVSGIVLTLDSLWE